MYSAFTEKSVYAKRKKYPAYKYRGKKYWRKHKKYNFRSKLSKFKKRFAIPKMTSQEMEYVDSVCNPFGRAKGGGEMLHGAPRALDPTGLPTFSARLTASYVYSGSTATYMVCKVIPPYNFTSPALGSRGIAIAYGDEDTTPTAWVFANWQNNYNGLMATLERFRIISSGLKIQCISGSEDEEGSLEGGNSDHPLAPSSSYNPFEVHTRNFSNEGFPVKQGMTVRYRPIDNTSFEFIEPEVRDADYGYAYARLPCIKCNGLGAETKVKITAVIYIECWAGIRNNYVPMSPSPVSTRWALLVAIVTHPDFAPVVVRGHSFRNIFTNAGYFINKIAAWIAKNAGYVGKFIDNVATTL